MKCPYCDNGVSRYSHTGFRWPCTICDGTGILPAEEEKRIGEDKSGDTNEQKSDHYKGVGNGRKCIAVDNQDN